MKHAPYTLMALHENEDTDGDPNLPLDDNLGNVNVITRSGFDTEQGRTYQRPRPQQEAFRPRYTPKPMGIMANPGMSTFLGKNRVRQQQLQMSNTHRTREVENEYDQHRRRSTKPYWNGINMAFPQFQMAICDALRYTFATKSLM